MIEKREGRSFDRNALLLFLIGVFSMTQIRLVGKIGISELVMCVFAPFVFLQTQYLWKRDGTLFFVNLILIWLVGGIVSDIFNRSPFQLWARGLANPVVLFSSVVCIYPLLRKNPAAMKWFLLGLAISSVVSIFIFQRGSAGDLASLGDTQGAIDKVTGYKLFWSMQLKIWLGVIICGWYLNIPAIVSCLLAFALAVFNLSVGARSEFLVMGFTGVLLFLGGREVGAMRRFRRMFPIFVVLLFAMGGVAKFTYGWAARSGYMGDAELKKYEDQTKAGGGVLKMLMSGRSETFAGLFAALDKPILGNGSNALDSKGWRSWFLLKYGDEEDIERYKVRARNAAKSGGFGGGVGFIPAHSHIICFWMYHGICGLVFWAVTIYLAFITLKNRMALVPAYFGYLAWSIPTYFWNVFFSPLGDRVGASFMFCVFLVLSRAWHQRRKVPLL